MAGTARNFIKQLRDQEGGWWLKYPPGERVGLGTIVTEHEGVWIPIGSVADREVKFDVDDDAGGVPTFTSQSTTGVKIESSLDLDPGVLKYVTGAQLGARVSFEGEDKYLLALDGVRYERVKSIEAFWSAVKAAYSVLAWNRGHRIVTTIARAASGTFLASGASEASYELRAKADVSLQGLQAANLAVGFSLVSTASSSVTFVGLADVTPLFRLHKVKLFGGLETAAAPGEGGDMVQLAETELVDEDGGEE